MYVGPSLSVVRRVVRLQIQGRIEIRKHTTILRFDVFLRIKRWRRRICANVHLLLLKENTQPIANEPNAGGRHYCILFSTKIQTTHYFEASF